MHCPWKMCGPGTLLFCAFACAIFLDRNAVSAMSEAQLKAAGKLIRNVCQPKTKATNEVIEGMHQGNWDIDRTGMCYMQCCLNMLKLMNKDNTFNYDYGLTQLKTLPEERKESAKICMDKCKDAVTTPDDKCQAGYQLSKCMYDCDPPGYFLP